MKGSLILDGGLGTSLQDQHGINFDSSTPLWASHLLVSDPKTLQKCQHNFVAAGCDVLLTATYQVSIEGFARTKTAEYPNGIPRNAVAKYLRKALDIAEQARGTSATKIALSLGPYGACMIPGQEYSGNYDAEHDTEDALFRWHLERLQLFLEADDKLSERVDFVAFETIPRIDEIHAVRRAIHAADLKISFWTTCVFPGDGDILPDGSSIGQIIQAATSRMKNGLLPWGLGINCTKIYKLSGLIQRFSDEMAFAFNEKSTEVVPTLVLYPDGTNGEVYNTTTQKWELQDLPAKNATVPWESQLAQIVTEARSRGPFNSFLVGGCCKASPEEIRKLSETLRIKKEDVPQA